MTDLIIPELEGYERGYNQKADIITQSLDGADLNVMWREFQASLSLFNRKRDALVELLTFPVQNPVSRVMQPSTEDFEEATEYGEPKGVRLGTPFSMGYGFTWWDIGARYTWMFLAESDQAQIEAINSSVLEAGNRLYFTRVMRQIFNSANTIATINQQSVNVYALYNADGTVPPSYMGTTFSGSHTHYRTSGATTIDPGDIKDLEDDLWSHGYRLTLGYKLVLMVNRQEGSVIRTFKAGVSGALYDFIPSSGYGGAVRLPQGNVIAGPSGSMPGEIGIYGPFIVVENDYIPAGYVLAFGTGGERNLGNLVGIREHENANLRGLQLVKGKDNDYPLTDSFYRFGFGTGIRQRGAGIVMQITASGTYTVPAIYA